MLCKRIQAADRLASELPAWRPSGTIGESAAPAKPAPAADLSRELDARIQAAYQQGHAAGEAAGAQRTAQTAAQRVDPAIAAFHNMTQELALLRRRFRAEAEEDTVKLAIAIARRVLHREIATDPEAILGLVIAAFQKLNARETQRLRIAPADAAVIEANRARLDLPAGLEIYPDASLPTGSVIFETSRGELDASIDTQLGEIERGFADIVKRRAR